MKKEVDVLKGEKTYFVVICEDEPVQRELLERLIAEYAVDTSQRLESMAFESAEAFLFHYAEDRRADLILLDIQLEGKDGLSLAEQLRSEHDHAQIIFITGSTEHIRDGYRVEAVDYLVKPFKKQQLLEALERAFVKLKQERPYLLVDTGNTLEKVYLNLIVAIESNGRDTEWWLADGRSLMVKSGISEAREQLVGQVAFFLSHRTTLVNLEHVARLEREEFIMADGSRLPIARRSQKAAKEAFLSYHLKGERSR